MTQDYSVVQAMMATSEPPLVTIREDIYDALLRLALAHGRELCQCENCPNEAQVFAYDSCKCGEDWSSCSEDVALLDGYLPGWRRGV